MFRECGENISMNRGDYGVPLPFRVKEHCEACGDLLDRSDIIRLEITKGGAVLVRKDTEYGAVEDAVGEFSVCLTEEESDKLGLGRYRWRLFLLREGKYQNTLIGPADWEVFG